MPAQRDCRHEDGARHLARPAERLVLEGYRCWVREPANGGAEATDALLAIYRDGLGTDDVRPALLALRDFVSTLRLCAKCPARLSETGTAGINPDEKLVLGLIAAMQHGDERTAEVCLRELTCVSRRQEVAMVAGTFALVLKGFGRLLLPVAETAVRDSIDAIDPATGSGAARVLH